MDVLSDVVAAARTGRPHSARVHKHTPWSTRHPRFAGAGFHVVLQGACWLTPPEGTPVALGLGDVVFLPHGSEHGLADTPSATPASGPSTSLAEVRPEPEAPRRDRDMDREGAGDGGKSNADAPTVLLCGAYTYDRERSHPLLAELPAVIHLPARLGRHPHLRAAVDLLGGELERPRPGSDAVLPALLDVLLVYILRAWLDSQSADHPTTGWAAALDDPAISEALRAIHQDPARPWTVQTLAAQAGLSRAAFARRFTALVGQPPLAYLTWWRMTLAARLLHESDAPLGTVATHVGYGSEFAFAHAFKRAYAMPPGRYRHARRAH
jgi:AraC-like DNA-binding protein